MTVTLQQKNRAVSVPHGLWLALLDEVGWRCVDVGELVTRTQAATFARLLVAKGKRVRPLEEVRLVRSVLGMARRGGFCVRYP